MAREIIVWKEPRATPANDGLTARQRRKQRKRAEHLTQGKHIFPSLYTAAHAKECSLRLPSSRQISCFTHPQRRMLTCLAAPHLDYVAKALNKRRYQQSQRWVNQEQRAGNIHGYQNEVRWGLKTGMTHLLSDEAQSILERLDGERRAALGRLNRARKAADPSANDEVWVGDW